MKTGIIVIFLFLAVPLFCQEASLSDFGYYSFVNEEAGDTLMYRLLKPYQYDSLGAIEYPVFIWLHPNGRQGTNNEEQMKDGWRGYLMDSTMRVTYPSFVLAPQCAPGTGWWNDGPGNSLFKLLDSLQTIEPIDASRIYVMGWSMGGFGIWKMMENPNWPHYFAAAVPIAGTWSANSPNFDPVKYEGTFIWAGHGSNDNAVNVSGHRERIAAIRAAGYDAIYSEFPIPHGSHDETMAEPGIWAWVFAQDRDGGNLPPAPTNVQVSTSGNFATLTWETPSVAYPMDSIMAYNIYKNDVRLNTSISDLTDSTGTGINELWRTNQFVDSNFVSGDNYEVRSVNFRNQESILTPNANREAPGNTVLPIHPNPTSSGVFLEGGNYQGAEYQLFTMLGIQIGGGVVSNNMISLEGVPPGRYVLRIGHQVCILLKI